MASTNDNNEGYLQEIDLRELAEVQEAERTCLSLYLSSEETLNQLDRRAAHIRQLLSDAGDELAYFERNFELVKRL